MNNQKIKLMSHEIEIRFENPGSWANDGLGRAYIKDQEILINNNMKSDMTISSMLHEITHLISDLLDLGMTEGKVTAFASGLFTLFKDNPEFIKAIIEELANGT